MVHQPFYLVLGDLTLFHDLNGLIASKLLNIDINVILINNNGGGIFSFLPQSQQPKHFELLYGTPLNLNFHHAVTMYDGQYELCSDWSHFTSSFMQNMKKTGLKVMEIPTNRDKNLLEHRELWNAVSQEITSRFVNGEWE